MKRRRAYVLVPLVAGALAVTSFVVFAQTESGSTGQFSSRSATEITPGQYADELDACLSRQDGQDASGCVDLIVDTALEQSHLYEALGVIRSASAQDQRYVALCHDSSHRAGQHAVSAGLSLEEAYAIAFPDCRFGFYHGALTQSTTGMSLEQLEENLDKLCSFFGDGKLLKTQECTHATGHLLVDRVGTDISRALRACQALGEEQLASRCVDGVLMQLMEDARQEGKSAKRDELWGTSRAETLSAVVSICTSLGGQSRYACWNNMPQLLAQLRPPADYKAIAQDCIAVAGDSVEACFEGIAASGFLVYGWDISRIMRACYAHESQWAESCVKSLAYTVGLQATNEVASKACQRALPDHVSSCESALDRGRSARAELGS